MIDHAAQRLAEMHRLRSALREAEGSESEAREALRDATLKRRLARQKLDAWLEADAVPLPLFEGPHLNGNGVDTSDQEPEPEPAPEVVPESETILAPDGHPVVIVRDGPVMPPEPPPERPPAVNLWPDPTFERMRETIETWDHSSPIGQEIAKAAREAGEPRTTIPDSVTLPRRKVKLEHLRDPGARLAHLRELYPDHVILVRRDHAIPPTWRAFDLDARLCALPGTEGGDGPPPWTDVPVGEVYSQVIASLLALGKRVVVATVQGEFWHEMEYAQPAPVQVHDVAATVPRPSSRYPNNPGYEAWAAERARHPPGAVLLWRCPADSPWYDAHGEDAARVSAATGLPVGPAFHGSPVRFLVGELADHLPKLLAAGLTVAVSTGEPGCVDTYSPCDAPIEDEPEEPTGPQVFTTGQVAKLCKVVPRTAMKWFDSGKLKGYRIPGTKDRRIPRHNLIEFLTDNGMSLPLELGGDAPPASLAGAGDALPSMASLEAARLEVALTMRVKGQPALVRPLRHRGSYWVVCLRYQGGFGKEGWYYELLPAIPLEDWLGPPVFLAPAIVPFLPQHWREDLEGLKVVDPDGKEWVVGSWDQHLEVSIPEVVK